MASSASKVGKLVDLPGFDFSVIQRPLFSHSFSDDKKLVVAGEREHAIALYMACKYLPPQLLASPGERKGMLIEASTLLEKIGDKKSLDACSKLMRSFGASVQA